MGELQPKMWLLNTTTPVARIYLKAKLLFILPLREEFCRQLCTIWRHCWPVWPEGAAAPSAPCPDSCTRSSHCSGAGQLLCSTQTSSTVWPGHGHTVVFGLGCLGTLIWGARGRNGGEEDNGKAAQPYAGLRALSSLPGTTKQQSVFVQVCLLNGALIFFQPAQFPAYRWHWIAVWLPVITWSSLKTHTSFHLDWFYEMLPLKHNPSLL